MIVAPPLPTPFSRAHQCRTSVSRLLPAQQLTQIAADRVPRYDGEIVTSSLAGSFPRDASPARLDLRGESDCLPGFLSPHTRVDDPALYCAGGISILLSAKWTSCPHAALTRTFLLLRRGRLPNDDVFSAIGALNKPIIAWLDHYVASIDLPRLFSSTTERFALRTVPSIVEATGR